VSRQIVDLAGGSTSFQHLARQAAFAQDTMLARYHAAGWAYHADLQLTALPAQTIRAVAAATAADCTEGDCAAERAALRAAFAEGAGLLATAVEEARAEIEARQEGLDAAILSEQLSMMSAYLDSAAWSEGPLLSDYGMEMEVVADRLVGTIALWRNVEPYVGLADPEIDAAINAASETLLKTLRLEMRGMSALDDDPERAAKLRDAAAALAAEFARAATIFTS